MYSLLIVALLWGNSDGRILKTGLVSILRPIRQGFKPDLPSVRCDSKPKIPLFSKLYSGKLLSPWRLNMPSVEKPSLYQRLGGVYNIATVVDDFIDRIMSDARLNANPLVNEAHHRVPPAGFKYLVTEMVCWATGGPQKYTGKSMAESHSHLKITSGEWESFVDDFQQTLDKFSVPAEEQAELKAILNSTRADIVFDSTQARGAA
jgi:hemoglobin